MKKLLVALALLILCAAVPMAQTEKTERHYFPMEYRGDACTGEVIAVNEEMKGLTKVFVASGADLKDRERIVKEIKSAKLGLTVLDSAEGAEIVLDFGSRTEHRDDNVPIYSYRDPTWIIGTLQVRKEVLVGRGRVSVVKDGKPRIVMSFEGWEKGFFTKKPATNFGKTFVKAYRRAHGAK